MNQRWRGYYSKTPIKDGGYNFLQGYHKAQCLKGRNFREFLKEHSILGTKLDSKEQIVEKGTKKLIFHGKNCFVCYFFLTRQKLSFKRTKIAKNTK